LTFYKINYIFLSMETLIKAIEIAGTQTELANKAGITQAAISRWLNGVSDISPASAIKIEKATDGQVTRADLRPDLFGDIDIPPSVADTA
jgi:DNA-binding transcriptional regulator YdaS (Cro superfamily)